MYNFGDDFIKWVKVLNFNNMNYINHNGWIGTSPIHLARGLRQGCPFSPVCYILATELLSCKLRQSNEVKGVGINNTLKILQYADDTTLFLENEQSFHNALSFFDKFSEISGLKLNLNKTEAMWLGTWKNRNDTLGKTRWKLCPNNVITILGISFSSTRKVIELVDQNIEPKFAKCEAIMKSWANRNLTVIGKITLAKSLIASQFLYLLQSFILPDHLLRRINTLLFKYIWAKSKYKEHDIKVCPEKVKRDIMVQNFDKGGLKMLDIFDMQKGFAFIWIKRLVNGGNGNWRKIPLNMFNMLGSGLYIFNSNCSYNSISNLTVLSEFYKNILKMWKRESECVNKSLLWYNDDLKAANAHLHFHNWASRGINFIQDVISNDNSIVTYDFICEKVGRSAQTWMQYQALCRAISRNTIVNRQISPDKNILFKGQNISKIQVKQIRQLLIASRLLHVEKHGRVLTAKDWLNARKVTKDTTLLELHWKILHSIYPCNKLLHKYGRKRSSLCDYCDEEDTLLHHFVECKPIENFWKTVYRHPSNRDTIFGFGNVKEYFVILIGKRAIHQWFYNECNGNILTYYDNEKMFRWILVLFLLYLYILNPTVIL